MGLSEPFNLVRFFAIMGRYFKCDRYAKPFLAPDFSVD